jgi:hypothetical protein
VGREWPLLCKNRDLFGRALLALDGRKCQAVNRTARNGSEPKRQQLRQHLHARREAERPALDAQDSVAAHTPQDAAKTRQAQMAQRRAHPGPDQEVGETLRDREETHSAWTEPASRSLPTPPGLDVWYHGPIAVAHKHPWLVEPAGPNAGPDHAQLTTRAKRAKETLAPEQREAGAAMGAYKGEAVKQCLESGVTPSMAPPKTSAHSPGGLCGQEACGEATSQDGSRCPGDQAWTGRCATIAQGRQRRSSSPAACPTCPRKAPCPRHKAKRSLTRWVHESRMEARQQSGGRQPETLQARQRRVAHPCGTMKRGMDPGYVLTRGLGKVRGALSRTLRGDPVHRLRPILGGGAWITAVGEREEPSRCHYGEYWTIGTATPGQGEAQGPAHRRQDVPEG